jgi:hypothetical protein
VKRLGECGLLGPFFPYPVKESGGAFAIVFLGIDRLIEVLQLLDIVLRWMLIIRKEQGCVTRVGQLVFPILRLG